MKINLYFILIALSIAVFQCGSDQATTAAEEEQTAQDSTEVAAENQPKIVAQQPPDPNVSPSEILENNAELYRTLRKAVIKHKAAIEKELEKSSFPEKMKTGLANSFDEVAKYDNITDMAQQSKYNSAETIEQFLTGLEMYMTRWGLK